VSKEHCESCNIDICYMCGSNHVTDGCSVKWNMNTVTYNQDYLKNLTEEQQLLNLGYLARFNITYANCPCGAPLTESEHSAFCVACANATCSAECHDTYIKDKGLCTFHQNFDKELKNLNMRSLTVKHNKKYHQRNLSVGTPICQTSQAFLYGMVAENEDEIYLQRGYRQYGEMQEDSYKALEIIKSENLEFVMNKQRACPCDCRTCSEKDLHPM